MITVKATREGLVGEKTASGYVVDPIVPFVALPSTKALFCFVLVRNPRNGLQTPAIVLDVGPWNTADDSYVFQPATISDVTTPRGGRRPQAESGIDTRGRRTNLAGIDLSEAVWKALGMVDNDTVDWRFLV